MKNLQTYQQFLNESVKSGDKSIFGKIEYINPIAGRSHGSWKLTSGKKIMNIRAGESHETIKANKFSTYANTAKEYLVINWIESELEGKIPDFVKSDDRYKKYGLTSYLGIFPHNNTWRMKDSNFAAPRWVRHPEDYGVSEKNVREWEEWVAELERIDEIINKNIRTFLSK